MAYTPANLNLVAQGPGDSPSTFVYTSPDARATVEGAGFFSDGRDRGMKVGDVVLSVYTTGYIVTVHGVSAVNATTGAVTVSTGN